jgi:DNA-binding response OmpR family regulator
MRLLIVEDDPSLGLFLQRGLKLEGHEGRIAPDGQTALQYASEESYDLIVLDLSLPQKDGVQVLEELRQNGVDASVLVLTGRNAVSDRVRCLDLGADDFLIKPFSFSELTARIRALMRRRERFADPILRRSDLELNRMERKVTRDGNAIDLTTKEFALLEYLMMARGRTCTRGELLKEVWQMSPDAGTNVVDVYVNYLRKKLSFARRRGLSGQHAAMEVDHIIETVRGEGYTIGAGYERKGGHTMDVEAALHSFTVDGFGRPSILPLGDGTAGGRVRA